MDIKWISFQKFEDNRGSLVVAENQKEIPFLVKRVYYIYDVCNGKKRGFHSHKNLKQIYIAIHGSIRVKIDDGEKQDILMLDDPAKGLYLGHNIWREIYDFSSDAVLLVLASENYNENDYIRNYDEFLESLKEDK